LRIKGIRRIANDFAGYRYGPFAYKPLIGTVDKYGPEVRAKSVYKALYLSGGNFHDEAKLDNRVAVEITADIRR